MKIDNRTPDGTCVKSKLVNEKYITAWSSAEHGYQVFEHDLSNPYFENRRYVAETKDEVRSIWDYVVFVVGKGVTP